MGDFESNPDIDEKPPMTLRECLEKAKPFLMAYENIQSHEEWEVISLPWPLAMCIQLFETYCLFCFQSSFLFYGLLNLK